MSAKKKKRTTSRRQFNDRPLNKRSYRKLFIIAMEGEKTEPRYFDILREYQREVSIKLIKGDHETSPPQVLKRMKKHLNEDKPRPPYEAWIVMDKDEWKPEQFKQIDDWVKRRDNYNFALSDPKFEYWLLLHFEDGNGVQLSKDCDDRLKTYISNYDKNIDASKITRARINDAIERARKRVHPPCTEVYKLVERILN